MLGGGGESWQEELVHLRRRAGWRGLGVEAENDDLPVARCVGAGIAVLLDVVDPPVDPGRLPVGTGGAGAVFDTIPQRQLVGRCLPAAPLEEEPEVGVGAGFVLVEGM
jgi:hypothetical protein